MSNKPEDWFSIQHQFTVKNAEDFQLQMGAFSQQLLDQIDCNYEKSLIEQPFLATNMLAMIGVNCESKSW